MLKMIHKRLAALALAVFLATAHPVKFKDVVEAETGIPVPIPERLSALLEGERHVVEMSADLMELRAVLLDA